MSGTHTHYPVRILQSQVKVDLLLSLFSRFYFLTCQRVLSLQTLIQVGRESMHKGRLRRTTINK